MSEKKRYVVVGTGGRAVMFVDAILDTYKESSELLGICDISQVRMDWHNRRIERARGCPAVATYTADRFDEMIADTKPNVVIVCTMDCFHHEYIVRAMDLGCDAISEKPMTTDAPKARAILEAIERTGRNLRVTFNYRYKAEASAMKQQIMAGAIGRPLSVDFSWMLHTSHGADYFRRWHREKDKSGGLLVHKATHHFDLVNWLIESHPKSVYCMGDLAFYGRKNAEKRGESVTYTRYTGEADAATDPFALHLDDNPHKLEDPDMKGLYLDAEDETGYLRDRNVFGDDITIEDTMAVVARYDSGVVLSYCLVAYAPWEGLRLTITGDRGRIELFEREGNHIIGIIQIDLHYTHIQNCPCTSVTTHLLHITNRLFKWRLVFQSNKSRDADAQDNTHNSNHHHQLNQCKCTPHCPIAEVILNIACKTPTNMNPTAPAMNTISMGSIRVVTTRRFTVSSLSYVSARFSRAAGTSPVCSPM